MSQPDIPQELADTLGMASLMIASLALSLGCPLLRINEVAVVLARQTNDTPPLTPEDAAHQMVHAMIHVGIPIRTASGQP